MSSPPPVAPLVPCWCPGVLIFTPHPRGHVWVCITRRAGNRQTLPEVPKSPEDRYAELAGQDVELPRSTTPSPGGSPDGKTRGVAPYGKITLPLPPGATRGQAAAAAPAAAPAVPPPPPPSHRPRKSPPLRNPSPSPPGFGQPDSPPPPGFAPAAAPVSANKPQVPQPSSPTSPPLPPLPAAVRLIPCPLPLQLPLPLCGAFVFL